MRMTKAQTSTEYLILLAVVIIITLIMINVLADIPLVSKSASNKVAQITLANQYIGISGYPVSNTSTLIYVQNNERFSVIVTAVTINELVCEPFTNITLRPGAEKSINCTNINTTSNDVFSFPVEFNYTDEQSGASFTLTDMIISGNVANS